LGSAVGVGVQREVAARRRRGRVWMYILVASFKKEVQRSMKIRKKEAEDVRSESIYK